METLRINTMMKYVESVILRNSNKYVVTCLPDNNNFLSLYNLVKVKAKQFNIFC